MICAFGVAALAGRPLFARGQRRLPGIRKYLEFRPKFSKFVFLGCARTRIRVSKGGPTGAAENLRPVSEVSPTKKSNHAFSFFSVPKGQALGSGEIRAIRGGTAHPDQVDAHTARGGQRRRRGRGACAGGGLPARWRLCGVCARRGRQASAPRAITSAQGRGLRLRARPSRSRARRASAELRLSVEVQT